MTVSTVGFEKRQQQTLTPRGVHFPFSKRSDGIPSGDSPPEIYSSNIKQIIMTLFGERVMRPTFGCGLRKLLFSPVSAATGDLMKQSITSAVAIWEPRVSLKSIDVQLIESRVRIQVTFLSPVGQGQIVVSVENM